VADGFYEWQKRDAKTKQPHLIHMKDGRPFAFAGLWEHWDHGDKPIESCTIITTEANELMRPLHERMPVIVAPDDYDRWLKDGPLELLRPYPPHTMEAYRVSTIVNSPRNEQPDCVKRLA
jgi:putative SOS response-associated peptidase YedK